MMNATFKIRSYDDDGDDVKVLSSSPAINSIPTISALDDVLIAIAHEKGSSKC